MFNFAADGYGLDPLVLVSIAYVESNFTPTAIGPTNDYGLMQIHYPSWKKIFELSSEVELYDAENSIMKAAYILDRYKKMCGKYYIYCYNAGPTKINQLLEDNKPLPKEYYNRVMDAYSQL